MAGVTGMADDVEGCAGESRKCGPDLSDRAKSRCKRSLVNLGGRSDFGWDA